MGTIKILGTTGTLYYSLNIQHIYITGVNTPHRIQLKSSLFGCSGLPDLVDHKRFYHKKWSQLLHLQWEIGINAT